MLRQRDIPIEPKAIKEVETENTAFRKNVDAFIKLIKRMRSDEPLTDAEIDKELDKLLDPGNTSGQSKIQRQQFTTRV